MRQLQIGGKSKCLIAGIGQFERKIFLIADFENGERQTGVVRKSDRVNIFFQLLFPQFGEPDLCRGFSGILCDKYLYQFDIAVDFVIFSCSPAITQSLRNGKNKSIFPFFQAFFMNCKTFALRIHNDHADTDIAAFQQFGIKFESVRRTDFCQIHLSAFQTGEYGFGAFFIRFELQNHAIFVILTVEAVSRQFPERVFAERADFFPGCNGSRFPFDVWVAEKHRAVFTGGILKINQRTKGDREINFSILVFAP